MNLRPEVSWFARQMERTLRKHDAKGGWDGCEISDLQCALKREVREMRQAIMFLRAAEDRAYRNNTQLRRSKLERVIEEATDVANYAMMIADNTNRMAELHGLDPVSCVPDDEGAAR